MPKFDPEREAHRAWIGLLQPVGLVVAPPALVKAQVVPDKNMAPLQQAVQALLVRPASLRADADPLLLDFPRFAREVLGWDPGDLAGAPGGPPLPERLAVALPDYGETLRPSFAVLDPMADNAVLMLVQVVEPGLDLDKPLREGERHGWQASPQARLERLLRDTAVPAGLLLNGSTLRLTHAPRGESSGHVGFPVTELCTVGGRPILAALHMLLCEHRVFSAPDGQRLLDLLAESRKYQSEVSTRLAEQVLGALWELLRGVQAADDLAGGRVLYDLPRSDPQQIYGGLLTVILRLVFLLYAEDRGLMPDDPVYARNYAIGGLYARLREDAGRHPDTMDQRFGAWAWLLSTFRLVFDGGGHGGLRLPTRHGQLFNPDEYPFLEGRPPGVHRVLGEPFEAPKVSDGVIQRVLEGLLVLDGERLSYRTLDVEQIGSVYESMMGFDVQTLPGRAVALRPKHAVVDLDALLAVPSGKREAWLKERADCTLTGQAAVALKAAATVEDLVAALERRLSPQTPRPLPPGALFLQPGEERRRSGSHYTPRELTEPIVRTTLRPVLEALGARPTPDQILALKLCDLAMGSGAFLVEADRQLAEALVAAWEAHGGMPALPPDEDPLLHARRLVAQHCLYGVDKNPFAVNLAKLSLWLATLAKDHAFTFLDHALRHGDSLVGLTKAQIGDFRWMTEERNRGPLFAGVQASVDEAAGWREQIQGLGEGDYDRRRAAWRQAEDLLHDARLIGDLCIAAFFGAEKDKERETLRIAYKRRVDDWKAGTRDALEIEGIVEALRGGERPVRPFHWEIEFPEVFGRENGGFDAVVGNPPFLGGTMIGGRLGLAYHEHLILRFPPSTGLADLVAFFLRRAFTALRTGGCFGLIATNTVAQGDTRLSGLQSIIECEGCIFAARSRYEWPGQAAVVVSVLHVANGIRVPRAVLDEREVERVSAFLLKGRTDTTPVPLAGNRAICFAGTKIWGAGFVFEERPSNGSSSLDEMRQLLRVRPENFQVVRPYMGGAEFNDSPAQSPRRFVIDFGDMTVDEAKRWPELFAIVEERVRPVRIGNKQRNYRDEWWKHANRVQETPAFYREHGRLLTLTKVSRHLSIGFAESGTVIADSMIVVLLHTMSDFAVLQSRAHEAWARLIGSSMKDDPRYTTPCFDTFPRPNGGDRLESTGQAYYDFRAALMIRNDEGLTKTYNRFHDPGERGSDILELRRLHAAMDRAVLDAYGWTDIPTDCDFLLDYAIDEETWGDKKKPWRYRWPDAVHDEVLARLLDLNQRRYQDEVTAGLHDKAEKKAAPAQPKAKAGRKPRAAAPPPGPTLFNWKEGGDG
ncbi:MAG: type IIL restriction-modification enzyme MmeI [Pseudomonadota bacterium]